METKHTERIMKRARRLVTQTNIKEERERDAPSLRSVELNAQKLGSFLSQNEVIENIAF